MTKSNFYKFVAITTGDVDGIGLEITYKALIKILRSKALKGPSQNKINLVFLVYRSRSSFPTSNSLIYKNLQKYIYTKNFNSAANALKHFESNNNFLKENILIVEIINEMNPALWVEEAAKLCLSIKVSSLVTGPLSKTAIKSSGLKDMGHTGILKRVSKVKNNLFMCFMGSQFNVLTLTGHIPIKNVESNLNYSTLKEAVNLASKLKLRFSKKGDLAVVGLNPHASEEGLIGNFDNKKLNVWIKKLRQLKYTLSEPLVPDVAFQKYNNKNYFLYICMYHDQALIPFKMIHGQTSGYHLTLGLPFVRTSVDHGTAKDIFKKNIADCSSMLEAILAALALS